MRWCRSCSPPERADRYSHPLMSVAVVKVWIMRVRMHHRKMNVFVGVGLASVPGEVVRVLVVLAVDMRVGVLLTLVLVTMDMMLRHV